MGRREISDEITLVYGFDVSERHRIARRRKHLLNKGYLSEYPLADNGSRLRISDIRDMGIKLPQTYGMAKHANCKGCLKAGKQHWYMVYCLWPDIFREAVWTEELLGCNIIKGCLLHEMEPLFSCMKEEGIVPGDSECSALFWSRVRRVLEFESFACGRATESGPGDRWRLRLLCVVAGKRAGAPLTTRKGD